jgi:hypothetical protein
MTNDRGKVAASPVSNLRVPARAAFALAGTFVLLLAALHVIKPKIDPS